MSIGRIEKWDKAHKVDEGLNWLIWLSWLIWIMEIWRYHSYPRQFRETRWWPASYLVNLDWLNKASIPNFSTQGSLKVAQIYVAGWVGGVGYSVIIGLVSVQLDWHCTWLNWAWQYRHICPFKWVDYWFTGTECVKIFCMSLMTVMFIVPRYEIVFMR